METSAPCSFENTQKKYLQRTLYIDDICFILCYYLTYKNAGFCIHLWRENMTKNYYEESKSKQIYLNLSAFARSVIEADLFFFRHNTQNLGTLINHIFQNYQESAQANIAKRLEDERAFLQEPEPESDSDSESDSTTESELSNDAIQSILSKKEKLLLSQKATYEKGDSFRIYLQNSNAELLWKQFPNQKYYKNPGNYLKQVIEEYATKPYWEREKIYFSDGIIKQINDAIDAGRKLRIVTGNREFFVLPYKITQDPMFMYNYLIGYSLISLDQPRAKKTSCSFRLSSISEIKTLSKGSLKKSEQADLEKDINEHGVQFMLDDLQEIKVKFTPQGEQLYQRNLHLRPNEIINPKMVQDKSEGIHVFYCTETQAEYYFFKFGADAVILSPLSLREKFQHKYESALSAYKDTQS